MRKENMKTVDKVWGEETWIVNCPEYCGKFLFLDRKAKSSYHYHKHKQETFYCIEGYATLTVEGEEHLLAPFTSPKTILPGERHMFRGITEAVILEISTHHEEDDVIRLINSEATKECAISVN